jgi:tRNA threonylcarbamoyladenosine biosynthesis protein TsaE
MKHIEKGTFFINSEAETRALGLTLAEAAEPGDIVALIGDLGTGKTALTKYIAEGLGVKEEVISPTFTIVKEYRSGRLPLYHFDVYRLSGPEEFYSAGAEDYIEDSGLSVIEWADIVADALPEDALLIHIQYADEGRRSITVL